MGGNKRGTNPRGMGAGMGGQAGGHMAVALVAALALTGCQDGFKNPFKGGAAQDGTDAPVATAGSVKLVDRDVEAPEVFQVTDQALWDGRPSLGGVWVASPDSKDPERVILRNPATGTFVIGALFRREAFNPGPKLQISSDAAAALGLLAGQPATVSVTALRREEVPATTDAENPILDAAESVAGEAIDTQAITTAPIAADTVTTDTIAVAGAALDKVEAQATPAAPVISASPATGSGRTIQIGIFSVEANAKRAADTLGKAGVTASIRKEESQGKVFWSVTVAGPGDGKALLDKVKGLGFTDAYFLRG